MFRFHMCSGSGSGSGSVFGWVSDSDVGVQNSISTKVNGKPDFETEKEQSRTDNIFYDPGFDCYDG